jgi:hypothetical protein
LRTSVAVPCREKLVPRQRWFTIVDPDPILLFRARTFAGSLAAMPRVKVKLTELHGE